MTIAITIKVFDGVVLAADSAATMQLLETSEVTTVYNNANKVFNLHKELPIGAVTWGLGNIGVASVATLMKDLRARLTNREGPFSEWSLDPDNYTVKEVAQRLFEFIYRERYAPTFADQQQASLSMGFIVGGYSSGSDQAEEFIIEVSPGDSNEGPVLHMPDPGGITWNGQPEAIHRLVMGFGTALPTVLEHQLGIPTHQIPQVVQILSQSLQANLVTPGMPIQDAIDLADFLADLAARFSRFTPGPATVGGPIEIAAITRHEGFKWVRRKHYYHKDLNPEEGR